MLRQIISCQLSAVSCQLKKTIVLCILSGILLSLPFLNGKLWILGWLGLAPLFSALEKKSKIKAFLLAYIAGIIFWSSTIYWLIHVTLLGQVLLILYLALYFGIFGLAVSSVSCQLSAVGLLFIPSVWVLLEDIRSHLFTGFPWALLGYSQYLNLPIIQIADITGAWGVSFLVIMVNVAVYSAVNCQLSAVSGIRKYVAVFLCLIVVLIYGYYKIYHPQPTTNHQPLKISVIQGNISQDLKWDIKARDFIVDKYLKLTAQVVKDKPDLIIWPEAAMPVVLEEEPLYYEKIRNFAKRINTPLLLGAVTSRNNLYYNSALLLSGDGQILTQYNKLHLVPFGEYIPLRKILPFLETVVPIGDIARGKEYTIFKTQDTRHKTQVDFAVLICFEDLFPELSRRFVKRGAKFLVNITNDAWYKHTSAPYQHLMASVFRAVENRIFLVRSANTGVSGFIRPEGKIISSVQDQTGREIFIDGYKTEDVALFRKRDLSFYTRYADAFILFCVCVVLYGIVLEIRTNQAG